MNVYLSVFTLSVFFLRTKGDLIYGITKEEPNYPNEPVALIRKNDIIELAVPTAQDELYIYYPYDPSKREEFFVACSDKGNKTNKILYEIKNVNKNFRCNHFPRPSVRKTKEKDCFYDGEVKKGVEYVIGYWVLNIKRMFYEHQEIYKICYADKEGTLYTALTVKEWKDLLIGNMGIVTDLVSFKSTLGSKFRKEIKKNKKLKPYQLVYWYDLPIESWRYTTLFNFNMILVPGKESLDLLREIDNYIRLSIRLTESAGIRVYAGTYKNTQDGIDLAKTKIEQYLAKVDTWSETNDSQLTNIDQGKERSLSHKFLETSDSMKLAINSLWKTLSRASRKENKPTEYTFIWKILHHESEGAIAIITLIDPPDECFEICPNISEETNWVIFPPSDKQKVRCVHACEIDGVINSIFGLSRLGKISKKFSSKVSKDMLQLTESEEKQMEILKMNKNSSDKNHDKKK